MIWTNICIGFEYTNIFVSKNLMLGFKLVIQPTVKTVFFLCILFLCILIYVDFLTHRLDFFSRIYLYQETIQTNIRIYSYQTNIIQIWYKRIFVSEIIRISKYFLDTLLPVTDPTWRLRAGYQRGASFVADVNCSEWSGVGTPVSDRNLPRNFVKSSMMGEIRKTQL